MVNHVHFHTAAALTWWIVFVSGASCRMYATYPRYCKTSGGKEREAACQWILRGSVWFVISHTAVQRGCQLRVCFFFFLFFLEHLLPNHIFLLDVWLAAETSKLSQMFKNLFADVLPHISPTSCGAVLAKRTLNICRNLKVDIPNEWKSMGEEMCWRFREVIQSLAHFHLNANTEIAQKAEIWPSPWSTWLLC